jgi:hypothetical protein
MTLMWDEYGLGLQPQSPLSMSYIAWGWPDFSQNSKSLVGMSGCNVVGTHPYAHPQHIKVVKHLIYVWHWCEMNMGWVYCVNHRISPWVILHGGGQISSKIPKAWSAWAAVTWWGHIHMHIHSIQGGVTDLALHTRNYLPSPVTGPEGRSFVWVCD